MHNSTDVDTSKRAIRAIEIEMAYKEAHIEERTFPKIDNVIIGVGIDRDLRRMKSRGDLTNAFMTEWLTK